MRTQRFVPTVRVLIIIILSIGLSSIFTIHADNPSPNGWSLSGGGFCSGTYTVFNTTSTPNPGLYAENCATGKNDFYNATDNGFLATKVIGSMANGGMVNYRQGIFAQTTTINFNGHGAVTLWGAGPGVVKNNGGVGSNNATTFESKTAGLTMIESTTTPSPSAPDVTNVVIGNLQLDGACQGGIGINFSMTENGGIDNTFEQMRIGGDTCGTTGFSTGIIADGNEDSFFDKLVFDGDGTAAHSGLLDLQFKDPNGDVKVTNSFFGGVVNLLVQAQTIAIFSSTVSSIKLAGFGDGSTQTISLFGDYLANVAGAGRFQLNGFTLTGLSINGGFLYLAAGIPFFAGTGTVDNLGISGVTLKTGTPNWNAGGATLTKQVTLGTNHDVTQSNCAAGACFTNFPFTIDANGNF